MILRERMPALLRAAGRALSSPGDRRVWCVILAGYFLLVGVLLFANHGICFASDSADYLYSAENVARGLPPLSRRAAYVAYAVIIAAFQRAGLGLPGVLAFQVGLAVGAAAALSALGRRLGGGPAGAIAATLFLWNPDIARWHIYILTESVYISMVILVAWSAHRATEKSGIGAYSLATVVLGIAALMRPNGWLLVPIVLCYWIAVATIGRAAKATVIAGVMAAFCAAMALMPNCRQGIGAVSPVQGLLRGEALWTYTPWDLDMPLPDGDSRGIVSYIVAHPVACTRLAAARIGVELLHLRPYYSLRHNLLIVLFYPLFYVFALWALPKLWQARLFWFCAAIVTAHLLVVALTFADPDGRFLLHVYPLMCLFAAISVAQSGKRILNRASSAAGNGNLEEDGTAAS